ncbi:phosphate permease [candidate division KSB3 bacterium]|uniref:Phosphate transporter n=1 Tax=candidate division KSB3 bacterium TaxID=2044937 RepID=A0A9D5Q4S1_9BACT|nr:phosphate permease [candidate division KSB3 bacterium]MBD3323206.1 phosphate permease [candidate division KSB3 bacterium]
MFVLILAAGVGFVMAMAIGANDVANSMATAVGAKAITIKQAVFIAAVLEFSGAFFFGKMVTETIRKGIVKPGAITDPETMLAGALAALLAAAVWIFIATAFELPVSTTHSIVGGMTGFGIVAAGIKAVNWGTMAFIVTSWFLSPVIGGLLAFGVFTYISRSILRKKRPFAAAKLVAPGLIGMTFLIVTLMFISKALHYSGSYLMPLSISFNIAFISGILSYLRLRKKKVKGNRYAAVEGIFRKLQVMTSCYVSLAHGANDVANAIGPLAVIYAIIKYGNLAEKVAVPKSLLAVGGLGIALGVAIWGHKVMKTIGTRITELNNTRGFSIDFSTATTVFLASALGLPVSSTHTVVGAVVGVGYARGVDAVDLGVIRQIVISWFITVPAGAIMAAIFYKILIHLL